jgi:hypothetical protein
MSKKDIFFSFGLSRFVPMSLSDNPRMVFRRLAFSKKDEYYEQKISYKPIISMKRQISTTLANIPHVSHKLNPATVLPILRRPPRGAVNHLVSTTGHPVHSQLIAHNPV